MNITPLYHKVVLLVLLVGIAAYAAAAEAPYIAMLALPIAFLAWRLSRPGTEGTLFRLPVALVNVLLLGAVGFTIHRSVVHGFDIGYAAELVIVIQLIKLGDRRTPRDDAQILALSVFLAIAAMLTSNTLWVGAILALYLPILVAAVMLFQLHKGSQLARSASDSALKDTPLRPAPNPEATSRQNRFELEFLRHFRRTTAFATCATLIAALAVFVIMPRGIGENTFGSWGQPPRASVTGFTDSVRLGTRGTISNSPTVVLDLVVRQHSGDGTSLPMGSTETVHYLRGAVLDAYHDGIWRTSGEHPTGEPKRSQSNVDLAPGDERTFAQPGGPLIEQTITLRNGGTERSPVRLFAAWRPVRIQVQRNSILTFHFSDGIVERRGDPGPLTYTVWSAFRDPPREAPDERTPTSFDSERISQLAASILSEAGIDPDPGVRPISDDSRAARAIQDYLRANYHYTLDEEYLPPGAHPIEHFLFNTQRGHCEYFASAMVAMCRSVGIYARVITGYVAAEFNHASGHYTVRESNAHAWVEAESGRGFWRRFDPTPPSDLARLHRPSPTIFTRIRQMIDAVEYAWNSTVVGFDAGRREQLLGAERVRESQFIRRVDDLITKATSDEEGRSTSPAWRFVATFLALALPAIGGVILWRWWGGWGMRRVRLRRNRRRSRGDRSIPFYDAYLDALRGCGHPKPDWRPPLAHARELEACIGAPAIRLVDLYYRARFSDQRLSPADLKHADALVAQIRQAAQRGERRGH